MSITLLHCEGATIARLPDPTRSVVLSAVLVLIYLFTIVLHKIPELLKALRPKARQDRNLVFHSAPDLDGLALVINLIPLSPFFFTFSLLLGLLSGMLLHYPLDA